MYRCMHGAARSLGCRRCTRYAVTLFDDEVAIFRSGSVCLRIAAAMALNNLFSVVWTLELDLELAS